MCQATLKLLQTVYTQHLICDKIAIKTENIFVDIWTVLCLLYDNEMLPYL